MIPSVVLVRWKEKSCIRLTSKKCIQIGLDENADIVVNHPRLHLRPQLLGPGSTLVKHRRKERRIIHFLFPSYLWHLDGIRIRMISLKGLYWLMLLACLSVFSFAFYFKDDTTFLTRQDWTLIKLPAEGVYGFCRQDRSHGEGVRFSFETKPSRSYRLAFYAGGEGDGTQIKFFLNGSPIDKPVSLPAGWAEERSIYLPGTGIISGENIIEVRPQKITDRRPNWGISEIRVVPAANPDFSGLDKGKASPGRGSCPIQTPTG